MSASLDLPEIKKHIMYLKEKREGMEEYVQMWERRLETLEACGDPSTIIITNVGGKKGKNESLEILIKRVAGLRMCREKGYIFATKDHIADWAPQIRQKFLDEKFHRLCYNGNYEKAKKYHLKLSEHSSEQIEAAREIICESNARVVFVKTGDCEEGVVDTQKGEGGWKMFADTLQENYNLREQMLKLM